MTLRDTIEAAWEQNHLTTALLELTYACNLNCSFCYNDLNLQGQPLSLSQYKQLLDELASMNTLHLILSGGEPLSHPQFFEIGAYAKSLGFVVRIKTNGHAVGPKIAKRLVEEVDPYRLEVSLHGATAATHDKQTRVEGSFERLMRNFGAMRDAGLRVQVNTALTKWNEHEITEMFSIVDRLGFRIQVDDEVKPRDDGDMSPTEIQASAEGRATLRALQIQYGAKQESRSQTTTIEDESSQGKPSGTKKHCGAGASTMAVDPVGNILPCVQWRMPVGNLHEASLQQIWLDQALADVRQTTTDVKSALAEFGDESKQLRFCPGLAHAQTGDPRSVYRSARQRVDGRISLPVVL